MPNDHRSVRRSTSRPDACSGDMYAGVPNTVPSWVSSGAHETRARPKSRIFTSSSREIMIFELLMSRWTMFLACATCRPSAMWQPDGKFGPQMFEFTDDMLLVATPTTGSPG